MWGLGSCNNAIPPHWQKRRVPYRHKLGTWSPYSTARERFSQTLSAVARRETHATTHLLTPCKCRQLERSLRDRAPVETCLHQFFRRLKNSCPLGVGPAGGGDYSASPLSLARAGYQRMFMTVAGSAEFHAMLLLYRHAGCRLAPRNCFAPINPCASTRQLLGILDTLYRKNSASSQSLPVQMCGHSRLARGLPFC